MDREKVIYEITGSQFDTIKELLRDAVKTKHFKEVKYHELSDDAIVVGYDQAPYGDWTYYIEKDGSLVSTYYSIGD